MKERLTPTEFLNKKGTIDVITGPMFCGKSDELIRRLRRYKIAIEAMQQNGIIEEVDLKERIMVFKPTIDDRRGTGTVNTNDGVSFPALEIGKAVDTLKEITDKTMVVAFDEAQFWPEEDLINTCRKLAKNMGKKIIVAGLSLNFKGERWGGVGLLALEADNAAVLTSICTKCGDLAPFSQRIIEETDATTGEKIRRPASYDDPIEVVGGTNLYEARCRQHHEVPGKPESIYVEK